MNQKETSVGAEAGEKEKSEVKWKYWVAVNGDGASACGFPLPVYPTVRPTPQLLIGFDTMEEQLRCQRFLLTGRLDKVRRYVNVTLPKLAGEGKVVLKKFKYPEAPSSETEWTYEGGEA